MESANKKARDIIKKILYINLATSGTQRQPWNSPVYAAYDEDYTFYWISWKDNVHSLNIRRNPKVFVVIYDSTAPEGTGEGVYIKGLAYELDDEQEIAKGLECLAERIGKKPEDVSQFVDDSICRVYKLLPQFAWINTQGFEKGHYIDKRIRITL